MAKRATQTSEDLSVDQAIKDLIADFPKDSWQFLLPDMAEKYGDPIDWKVESPQTRKTDYRKKGFVMDVPISYTFQGGKSIRWWSCLNIGRPQGLSIFSGLPATCWI